MAVATKTPTSKDLLGQLSRDFDPNEVKYRSQGGKEIPYISIDMTINRLNEVVGVDWSFVLTDTQLLTLENGKYLATVAGELKTLGKVAAGVGADVAADPDKVFKTALAEAIKKAGHQLGIGLELWDEGHRQVVAKVQAATAAGDTVTAVKVQVMEKALKAGVEKNAEKIAAHFNVSVEDLQNIDVLKGILARG